VNLNFSYAFKTDPMDVEDVQVVSDKDSDAWSRICASELRKPDGIITLEQGEGSIRLLVASELAWLEING